MSKLSTQDLAAVLDAAVHMADLAMTEAKDKAKASLEENPAYAARWHVGAAVQAVSYAQWMSTAQKQYEQEQSVSHSVRDAFSVLLIGNQQSRSTSVWSNASEDAQRDAAKAFLKFVVGAGLVGSAEALEMLEWML
jgi:hypothetical protein